MSKWKALKIDETDEWSGMERYGKIYGIYLYDAESGTYLCELRPSRYLIPIDVVCSATDVDEDDLQDLQTLFFHFEQRDYMLRDTIDAAVAAGTMEQKDLELDDDADEDDAIDAYNGAPLFD